MICSLDEAKNTTKKHTAAEPVLPLQCCNRKRKRIILILFPVFGGAETTAKILFVNGFKGGDFYVEYKQKNTTRPLTNKIGDADLEAFSFRFTTHTLL